jgi:hypothetical protein
MFPTLVVHVYRTDGFVHNNRYTFYIIEYKINYNVEWKSNRPEEMPLEALPTSFNTMDMDITYLALSENGHHGKFVEMLIINVHQGE